jgi:redox-sensitive bicupin YhaK (pirin superfamily)
MTTTVIPSASRGHNRIGWLDSKHTFSFGRYYNPDMMGFGPLRVINDDIVAPGRGFHQHPHDNMEIFTYILSGALEHRDTTGGHAILRRGDIQAMSAGTGLEHSEMNASQDEPVHLLQIWIEPDARGHRPRHAEARFDDSAKRNRLALLAAPDAEARRSGALPIHQDARIFATVLDPGAEVAHELAPGRAAWVHIATGSATVNGASLSPGDAAAITAGGAIRIAAAAEAAEVLVFDLPGS